MGKKIIANFFNYAIQEGVNNLVIASRPNHVSLDYHFPGGERRNFVLPKKLEQNFLANLRQILAIAPGELITQKYCKIYDKNHHLAFYLTILPDDAGEKIIINIVNRPTKLWRLGQLGLRAADLRELKTALNARSGLIIISSPPNNGKSATLYSLLSAINDPSLNIYLFSQHPELEISGVNPLAPTAANWEKVLQHDSEVIVADDLNEDWALKNALRAAATGRLVLGTLTAASSWEVLAKILKIELPLKLKLDNLKMIVSQRLANLKRAERKTAKKERRAINLKEHRAIGLFEILKLSPALKKFILKTKAKTAPPKLKTAPPKLIKEMPAEKFQEKLEKLALRDGFRPWEFDRRQKIKDGLL